MSKRNRVDQVGRAAKKLLSMGARGATALELGNYAIIGERWAKTCDIHARDQIGKRLGRELVKRGVATLSGHRFYPKQDTSPVSVQCQVGAPITASRLTVVEIDGSWSVVRQDGHVVASGLSNAKAWELADAGDQAAARMEDTRIRIGVAFSTW